MTSNHPNMATNHPNNNDNQNNNNNDIKKKRKKNKNYRNDFQKQNQAKKQRDLEEIRNDIKSVSRLLKRNKEIYLLIQNITELENIDEFNKNLCVDNITELINNNKKLKKLTKKIFSIWKQKPRAFYNMHKGKLY